MRTEDGFTLLDADEFTARLATMHITRPIRVIQNHHTWRPNYAGFHDNHFSLLRGMRTAHMRDRHWTDIGQTLTTFPDGTVALCRPFDVAPACAKGANTHGVCIEHVGDFDTGADAMTATHREVILRVNAALCDHFRLAPSTATIVYHHWFDLETGARTNGSGTVKSCPGTGFFGGNGVRDAELNFIPEVKARMIGAVRPVAPVALGNGTVDVDRLNVRERPSRSARVLRRIPRGEAITWYEQANGDGILWNRISPAAQEWVAARFIH